MKPARSEAHLAFIRSLPCCVSGRIWGVEAAHVGIRGMSQKASDFDTIPLNRTFHQEQHRIGLKRFCKTYDLNLTEMLGMLKEKPRIKPILVLGRFGAEYQNEFLVLGLIAEGLPHSLSLLKDRAREMLSERILARIHAFRTR